MNPLNLLEKAINEHGSSVILKEHLALVKEMLSKVEKERADLEKKCSDLEEKLAEATKQLNEKWEQEKKRYKLLSPWASAAVYAVTKANCNDEPPHWICTACYQEGKKSFLNPRRNNGYEEFFCKCGAIVAAQHRGKHTIKYFEEYEQ